MDTTSERAEATALPIGLEQFGRMDASEQSVKQPTPASSAKTAKQDGSIAAEYAGRPADAPASLVHTASKVVKPHKAMKARPPHPDDHVERATLAAGPGEDDGPGDGDDNVGPAEEDDLGEGAGVGAGAGVGEQVGMQAALGACEARAAAPCG